MIAVSVLFLAAAIATFLVGVFSTGLQMIGASIGCSVAAALLLLIGVMRDSRKRPAVAAGGMSVSTSDVATYVAPSLPEESEMTPVLESEFASEPHGVDEAREDFYGTPATESYSYEPKPAPARKTTRTAAKGAAARKPAAKKATARKPAAKKAAPKKAAARKPAAKKAAPRKPAARRTTNG